MYDQCGKLHLIIFSGRRSTGYKFSYAGINISFSTIIYSGRSIKICKMTSIRDQRLKIEDLGINKEYTPPLTKLTEATQTRSSKADTFTPHGLGGRVRCVFTSCQSIAGASSISPVDDQMLTPGIHRTSL